MKYSFLVLFLFFTDVVAEELSSNNEPYYNDLVVLVPSYNNAQFYQWNLDSILSQDYPASHVKIIYMDDLSSDGTADLVQQYLEEFDENHIVQLVRNTRRCFAMDNLWRAAHSAPDNAIILTLDGDDAFPHDQVLAHVNDFYNNHAKTWMTWGQLEEYPSGAKGFTEKIPDEIVKSSSFRSYKWVSSHLRTFRAWLFKRIKLKDLLYDGKFLRVTWDMGMMFPMLEMAKEHGRFIDEVLYLYNRSNPISDQVIYTLEQRKLDIIIRSKQQYEAVFAEPKKQRAPTVTTIILARSASDIPHKVTYLQSMLHGVSDYIVVMPHERMNSELNGMPQNVKVVNASGTYAERLANVIDTVKTTHCFLVSDQIKLTKPIDIMHCCNAMKKTHAHCCFIAHSHFMSNLKCVSNLLDIDVPGIKALQYKYCDELFLKRNAFLCVLYERKDLEDLVAALKMDATMHTMVRHYYGALDLEDVFLIAI